MYIRCITGWLEEKQLTYSRLKKKVGGENTEGKIAFNLQTPNVNYS